MRTTVDRRSLVIFSALSLSRGFLDRMTTVNEIDTFGCECVWWNFPLLLRISPPCPMQVPSLCSDISTNISFLITSNTNILVKATFPVRRHDGIFGLLQEMRAMAMCARSHQRWVTRPRAWCGGRLWNLHLSQEHPSFEWNERREPVCLESLLLPYVSS